MIIVLLIIYNSKNNCGNCADNCGNCDDNCDNCVIIVIIVVRGSAPN